MRLVCHIFLLMVLQKQWFPVNFQIKVWLFSEEIIFTLFYLIASLLFIEALSSVWSSSKRLLLKYSKVVNLSVFHFSPFKILILKAASSVLGGFKTFVSAYSKITIKLFHCGGPEITGWPHVLEILEKSWIFFNLEKFLKSIQISQFS